MSYIGANSQGIIGVANTDIIDGSTITNATLDSSVRLPAGSIIQVQSSLKTDKNTTQSTSFTTIPGTDQNASGSDWIVRITPKFTTSKILIHVMLGAVSINGALNRGHFRLYRGGTALGRGDGATGEETSFTYCPRSSDGGWNQLPCSFGYVDDFTISANTEYNYGVYWRVNSSSNTVGINSAINNDAYVGNTSSIIIAYEIAA